MPVNFLKKEKEIDWVFFSPAADMAPGVRTGRYRLGSDTGMRYRMEMTKREVPKEDGADGETVEETVLTVTSWPEPYGYDATPEEEKTREEFPFSEEGIVSGVEWLNGQHARYVKPEK